MCTLPFNKQSVISAPKLWTATATFCLVQSQFNAVIANLVWTCLTVTDNVLCLCVYIFENDISPLAKITHHIYLLFRMRVQIGPVKLAQYAYQGVKYLPVHPGYSPIISLRQHCGW